MLAKIQHLESKVRNNRLRKTLTSAYCDICLLFMYPFRNFSECQKIVKKRARFCGKDAKRARWGNLAQIVVNKPKVVHSSMVKGDNSISIDLK